MPSYLSTLRRERDQQRVKPKQFAPNAQQPALRAKTILAGQELIQTLTLLNIKQMGAQAKATLATLTRRLQAVQRELES